MPLPKAPIVVVRDSVDSFQLALVRGVRSVLDPLGVPVVEHLARLDGGAEPPVLGRLLSGGPAGVLVPSCRSSPPDGYLARLLRATGDLPKVFVLQEDPTGRGSTVRGDNAMGVRLLVQHLVTECGVRSVLAVRGVRSHPDSLDRERLLRGELAAAGLDLPPGRVVTGDFSREVTYRAVRDALRDGSGGVDAVVCFNDLSAIGALDAVRDAGLRVPRDVVVTGYDDDQFSSLVRPALTTVDQDLAGQGARAAALLLEMIDGGPARAVSHPVRLLRRASTARDLPAAPEASDNPEAPVSVPDGARPWEYVWNAMISMDTMLEVSRALFGCRSVPELVRALGAEMERLQAGRAFLVLREDPPPGEGDLLPGEEGAGTAGPPRGRLCFAVDDGAVPDVADERPFALERLLPAHLEHHLQRGWLSVQPVGSGTAELGYLLVEQAPGATVMVGESLGLDLFRALDAIRSARRLARHADELEALVARRTAELESELATRRAAEQGLGRANAHLLSEVAQRQAAETQLRRLNQELHALASRDGLTGVANRAAFDDALALQLAGCARAGSPLSLVMIDVDAFKAYNDEYGHLAGDDALRVVGGCLREAVHRPNDLAARYGGEEFALVLPSTDSEGATVVAGQLAARLAALAVPHTGGVNGVLTLSMGVATLVPGPRTVGSDLVAVADRRLYRAKREGRDRIVAADPLPE